MNRILLLSTVFLSLLFVSCKYSYRITVKEPAEIRLPSETKVIGVINNVTEENSPEKVIATLMGAEQLNGNVTASERAVEGVLRALSDSEDIRGEIVEMDSTYYTDGTINWTILDSIGRARGIDAFIELSELRSISPVGGTILASATGQTNNRLTGTLYMNVHEVETNTNHQRYSVTRTYNIPISGTTNIIDLLNDVQRKREYYRELGFQLGYEVGQMVYPNWVWVGRMYYTRGTPAVKRARNMLKEGNWDIAERQLLQDEEFEKIGKRGRVLFNLALVKEAQGEIDLAIAYAERAALECANKEANSYLVQLRERKRLMEELEEN